MKHEYTKLNNNVVTTTNNEREIMENLPAVKAPKRQGYLVATTIKEAKEVAEIIASTDFLPKSYRDKTTKKPKINEIIIAGNMGARHGWDMFQSIQAICVINNRPSIWGEYYWGLILSAPNYIKHEEIYDPDTEGGSWTVKIWKKGSENPVVGVFSIQDASTAGLLSNPDKKHTWGKYPKDLCLWKARKRAGNSGFANVIQGFDMVEEARDIVDVTYQALDKEKQIESRTEKLKADLNPTPEAPPEQPETGDDNQGKGPPQETSNDATEESKEGGEDPTPEESFGLGPRKQLRERYEALTTDQQAYCRTKADRKKLHFETIPEDILIRSERAIEFCESSDQFNSTPKESNEKVRKRVVDYMGKVSGGEYEPDNKTHGRLRNGFMVEMDPKANIEILFNPDVLSDSEYTTNAQIVTIDDVIRKSGLYEESDGS